MKRLLMVNLIAIVVGLVGNLGWEHAVYSQSPLTPSSNPIADTAFQTVWEYTDLPVQANVPSMRPRSWVWGPQPLTAGMQEPFAEGAGGTRLVQYFDKSRMELNDPASGQVTNGLLVVEMIQGRVQVGTASFEERQPSDQAVAGDPAEINPNTPTYRAFRSVAAPVNSQHAEDRTGQVVTDVLAADGTTSQNLALADYGVTLAYYEQQSGHNIANVFTDYFAQQGLIYENGNYHQAQIVDWLFAAGLPLSEPYWAKVYISGQEKDVLIQAFERRIVTYTPSNDPDWRVEMGNVGQHYLLWRYGTLNPEGQQSSTSEPAPSQQRETGSVLVIGEGVHMVVGVQGAARYTRPEWNVSMPLQVGTYLYHGDTVELDATAQVQVTCSSLSRVTVTSASGEMRCDQGTPVLMRHTGSRSTLLGSSQDVQLLLTPRKTQLLTRYPLIRWRNISGVEVTHIEVQGPGVRWSAEVQGMTQIRYPTDADPLQPGKGYTIVLKTTDPPASVNVESLHDKGFVIVSEQVVNDVKREEEFIRNGEPESSTSFQLPIAKLYYDKELYAEEIELLERISPAEQEVQGYLLLGDAYFEIELYDIAISHYQQALDMAVAAGNVDDQAQTHHNLGQAYRSMGDETQATTHFDQAIALYQQLGDANKVQEVTREKG